MKSSLIALFLFLGTLAVAKDPEPYLKSASMPFYPPLARQARIQGEVKISFVVNAEGEAEDISASSGHPILKSHALEQVKTWKFGWPSPCSCRVKQEAIFTYKIKDGPSEPPVPRVTVRWFSANRVEIETDPAPINTIY